ncbi:hypothetical protein FSP39_020060 [Pinctada imbricata]|uniref:glutathione gamma-glutamylcysteinyltransferase n=1 Tax=Pinctada imbricata TaxID=66713 RepID=A0AA88YK89_PINIB|nr:hypothetical protein FSP39_020060 [Pinctada imbricata]
MTSSANPKPIGPIYRRPLPSSCIDFSSPDGKNIFQEALSAGNMECYFRLAAQFRTQDEPAFCGLTTLVMILNSLEIDPGQVWKAPWRWYHESMLDCCIQISNAEVEGISFEDFISLAKCNSLHVDAIRATDAVSLEDFRRCVKRHAKKADVFVILTYSRQVLSQTGEGHFSPMGGYHEGKDLVLILDTARFKYPPHWVPVSMIWEAMKAIDVSMGKPRGYMVISRYEGTSMLTLFRISSTFSITYPGAYTDDVSDFVTKWQSWLAEDSPDGLDDKRLIYTAVSRLLQFSTTITSCESVLTTQVDLQCLSENHACECYKLLDALELTDIFKEIQSKIEEERNVSILDRIGMPAKELSLSSAKRQRCCLVERISPDHFVTTLLLCWPYNVIPNVKESSIAYKLDKRMAAVLNDHNKVLSNEIEVLRRQFTILLTKRKQSQCCKSFDKEK